MPVTENPGGSPAQQTEPFAWLETVALVGGAAITVITLWVWWRTGKLG